MENWQTSGNKDTHRPSPVCRPVVITTLSVIFSLHHLLDTLGECRAEKVSLEVIHVHVRVCVYMYMHALHVCM